jgi:hypothetical protein
LRSWSSAMMKRKLGCCFVEAETGPALRAAIRHRAVVRRSLNSFILAPGCSVVYVRTYCSRRSALYTQNPYCANAIPHIYFILPNCEKQLAKAKRTSAITLSHESIHDISTLRCASPRGTRPESDLLANII